MTAFNFKFKSVQNVKKNLEKKAQRELAFIENQIESLKSSKEDILTNLKDHRIVSMQTVKTSEIKFLKGYALCLEEKIERLDKNIRELEIKKENKINELLQKSKEHKMFDKIEEKHLERFNFDLNKSELKKVDEIAVRKYLNSQR